jgi:hypothetical protein
MFSLGSCLWFYNGSRWQITGEKIQVTETYSVDNVSRKEGKMDGKKRRLTLIKCIYVVGTFMHYPT